MADNAREGTLTLCNYPHERRACLLALPHRALSSPTPRIHKLWVHARQFFSKLHLPGSNLLSSSLGVANLITCISRLFPDEEKTRDLGLEWTRGAISSATTSHGHSENCSENYTSTQVPVPAWRFASSRGKRNRDILHGPRCWTFFATAKNTTSSTCRSPMLWITGN